MSRSLVGCSHPSIVLENGVWRCTSCHNEVGRMASWTYGCPPHPAIYRDAQGNWRCTECQAYV